MVFRISSLRKRLVIKGIDKQSIEGTIGCNPQRTTLGTSELG